MFYVLKQLQASPFEPNDNVEIFLTRFAADDQIHELGRSASYVVIEVDSSCLQNTLEDLEDYGVRSILIHGVDCLANSEEAPKAFTRTSQAVEYAFAQLKLLL